jgi:hypothetical protein
MKKYKRALLLLPLLILMLVGLTGCTDADIASQNISKKADYFEINRRIIFYNGITGEYMLAIEGFCSLGNDNTTTQISITCKIGDEYKKHFLGLSDNVTYFIEQIEAKDVSKDHYLVVFNPSAALPSFEVK